MELEPNVPELLKHRVFSQNYPTWIVVFMLQLSTYFLLYRKSVADCSASATDIQKLLRSHTG